MKKVIIIALLGLGAGQVFAQKIRASEVPQVVKASFAKAYPSVKDVEWEKEGGAFEAGFDENEKDVSVVIDVTGKIKEVETEIQKSELPKTTRETLAKEYAGYKIKETAKLLASGVTTFEAEVEKGEKSYELIFDTSGKLLKKTEIKEKEKEEDK